MFRKMICLSLVCLFLFPISACDAGNEGLGVQKELSYICGYGACPIPYPSYDEETGTFTETMYMGGYQNELPATGKLDDQYVRACYLSDGVEPIILCSVDCVALGLEDLKKVREKVKDITRQGISLHIAATHDHAGLDTLGLWGKIGVDGKNADFMNGLYSACEMAIRECVKNQKEGTLFFGYADTGDLQQDSRLPEVYDRNIYRIRFQPKDGSSGIQILSYTSHCESLRGDNTLVSADFPCYLGRKIKEKTGDDFLFFVSSVGGLVMTKVFTDEDGNEIDKIESCRRTGEFLADCVLSISNEQELPVSLEHASVRYRVDLDNSLFIAMSALGVLSAKAVKGNGSTGLAMETMLSAIRLGGKAGVTLLMTPGEPFSELISGEYDFSVAACPEAENPPAIQDLFDGKLIVFGLCDDEIGYIVPPYDFLLNEKTPYLDKTYDALGRRHYEETNSVGPDSAWALYRAAERLSEEFK